MNCKPWREVAEPHQDVRNGKFQQAEFAADLSRVHAGNATPEYQDPALFFERTYITEGLHCLLDCLAKRLTGQGGDPVIQLQTAFGGGKTHSLLAVYHLAKRDVPASQLHGVSPILDAAGITDLPTAKVAVLDGTRLAPDEPQTYAGQKVRTLWGELAWQLGGASAFDMVRAADENGTSPGKDRLIELLSSHAPCVVLMDELVAYLRQFEDSKHHEGGTFDSNLTFIQALTEAMKAVPNAILLASLPESRLEVGSSRGQQALDALEKFFGRVQAIWKPVATEESFEIVRRRLFVRVQDQAEADRVCEAFSQAYDQHKGDFPNEAIGSDYLDRMKRAYPIHPEVFDRLYEDWSTLDKFQRTRGVLKLMARVIHRLWKDDNRDAMIMPGSLPLYDATVRTEAINYLPQGWDPVIEKDVDGDRSETSSIDSDTRFGSVNAAKRTARSIFLGSAPSSSNQMARGVEEADILLGSYQPGQQVSVFKDVLRRLTDRLHYLNIANGRFWLDTRPNLRREMEDRKVKLNDREQVWPVLRERLQAALRGHGFDGLHIFTHGVDVPDDASLRLVVLPPDAAYGKTVGNKAEGHARNILEKRGDQPRLRQNRLLFLAADYEALTRTKEQVRAMLAWRSIVSDVEAATINLDTFQTRQARDAAEQCSDTADRLLREAWCWLLAPEQGADTEGRPGELRWEAIRLSASAQSLSKELHAKIHDNELVIEAWSPTHLKSQLQRYYWHGGQQHVAAVDFWQDSLRYLYLPRLKNEDVYRTTIANGATSLDFFGLAWGQTEGGYEGFSLGKATIPMLDASFLLIEPATAAAYQARLDAERAAEEGKDETPRQPGQGGQEAGQPNDTLLKPTAGGLPASEAPTPQKTRFYGRVQLEPVKAKLDFAQIVDGVLEQFTARHNTKVAIKIEIEADCEDGFDDGVQRTVRENCNELKFESAEFEG